MKFSRLVLAGLALAAAQPVLAQTVSWASKPADGSADANSAAVIGQPDGVATAISFFSASYVREFVPGKVSLAALEKAMKLPAGELAKWDVIAIGNLSTGASGFNTSMWMANDLKKISSALYESRTGAAAPGTGDGWKFRSGSIAKADFKALYPSNRIFVDASFLLIKLPPAIDKSSPNLAIWMGGGPLGVSDGIISPDAIGVVR